MDKNYKGHDILSYCPFCNTVTPQIKVNARTRRCLDCNKEYKPGGYPPSRNNIYAEPLFNVKAEELGKRKIWRKKS